MKINHLNSRAFFVMTSLVLSVAGTATAQGRSPQQARSELQTGRVIVKFNPLLKANERALAHAQAGSRLSRVLRGGAHVVTVDAEDTEATVAFYRSMPEVAWAEADALVPLNQTTTVTPNDPLYGSQWQHANIESAGGWAYGTGSPDVRIAICDTGVSATHPDLQGALRMDLCYNTANNSAGNCDPVANHGTAVAGCAAAIGNNALGVAGVAWTAQIIPVRVSNLFNGSAYISDMAECIYYSSDVGAHVINLSYQTYSNGSIFQSLLDAATYAEGKGAVTVFAAGNENTQAVTSQDPANILYASATASTNARSSFSNFGPYVDVAAPGSSVYTTNVSVSCTDANGSGTANPGECTVTGNGYTSISGTSFSAPITAGAAALLKALNPAATPAEIRLALQSTATDLGTVGEDIYFGAGLINVRRAAASFSTPPAPNTAPSISLLQPAGGSITVDPGVVVTFSATAFDAEQGDLSANIVWRFPNGTTVQGNTVQATFSSGGTYSVTGSITDAGGLSASTAVTVTVNAPPVPLAPSSLTATLSSRTVSLRWVDNATNENGYYVDRAKVSSRGVLGSWAVVGSLGANATSFTQSVAKGIYAYRVRAYNAGGSTASNVVQVTIR